ncbi:MAG: glycine--tRNA ligase subunit beta, partial [Gammaproteobacteria bacterium]|nr:glycine--tRNA ligase subunit beta [Gammaproteobacteria bacterium]
MWTYDDFLLEIGCEELPARMQPVLINALEKGFEQALAELALTFKKIHSYSTPRRLAILIEGLQTETVPTKSGRLGPLLNLAIDTQGMPTAAGLGFAKSCGVDFSSLERKATEKGECLYHSHEEPAQKTAELLPALCEKIIAALPIAKPMRWGDGAVSFARPVHWIVLLLGKEVIPAKILGQK